MFPCWHLSGLLWLHLPLLMSCAGGNIGLGRGLHLPLLMSCPGCNIGHDRGLHLPLLISFAGCNIGHARQPAYLPDYRLRRVISQVIAMTPKNILHSSQKSVKDVDSALNQIFRSVDIFPGKDDRTVYELTRVASAIYAQVVNTIHASKFEPVCC